MIGNWLYRIIHWRSLRAQRRRLDDEAALNRAMVNDLDKRVESMFKPGEWREVEDRCMQHLLERERRQDERQKTKRPGSREAPGRELAEDGRRRNQDDPVRSSDR